MVDRTSLPVTDTGTYYARYVRNNSDADGGKVWNSSTSALVDRSTAAWADTATSAAAGSGGFVVIVTPSALPWGQYTRTVHKRATGTALSTDELIAIDTAYEWNGDAETPEAAGPWLESSVQATSTASSILAGTELETTDGFYEQMYVVPQEGTYKGIPRRVTVYTGATRTLTVEPFPGIPATGTRFVLIGHA